MTDPTDQRRYRNLTGLPAQENVAKTKIGITAERRRVLERFVAAWFPEEQVSQIYEVRS